MKPVYGLIIIICIVTAPRLHADTNDSDNQKKITYGRKGVIELSGGLSLSGSSHDFLSVSFTLQPGLNYFAADNFYVGAHLLARINKGVITENNLFFPRSYYKTRVDLGLSVPFGYLFKVKDHVYFNLVAPEFQIYLDDLSRFRLYPNFITSFKFPFDNTVLDFGIKHNFFNITNRRFSDPYYSYNVFFGFSVLFDTVKKKETTETTGIDDIKTQNEKIMDTIGGKVAGSFFMSLLPVCSGSWLAGWDPGGLVFSVLKTGGLLCTLIPLFTRGTVSMPYWIFAFGIVTWPIMTLTDLIYSPSRVTYRLKKAMKGLLAPEKTSDNYPDKHEISDPDVYFIATPRLSVKKEKQYNTQSPSNYTIDGVNLSITHVL